MALLLRLRDQLVEPRLEGVAYDSSELIAIHREILSEKPMLLEVFREFYAICREIDEQYFSGDGARVELGAGVSLFKSYYPDIVSTDIKSAPHLDGVLDALDMDLPDSSTRAFYGLNCFHHFPDPQKFFDELNRVLQPGGGCVLIEPYYGPIASAFYKRVHKTEHFNKEQESWITPGNLGVMVGANQALSYLVFRRDAQKFLAENPNLEIVFERPLDNYLRYLISGGLNFKQLLPTVATPLVKFVEWALKPINRFTALHYIVVIRKTGGPS